VHEKHITFKHNMMIPEKFDIDDAQIDLNDVSTVASFDVDQGQGRVGDANAPDISITEVLSLFLVAGLAFASGSAANDVVKSVSDNIKVSKRREWISKIIKFLVIVIFSILVIYALYYVLGINVASNFVNR